MRSADVRRRFLHGFLHGLAVRQNGKGPYAVTVARTCSTSPSSFSTEPIKRETGPAPSTEQYRRGPRAST